MQFNHDETDDFEGKSQEISPSEADNFDADSSIDSKIMETQDNDDTDSDEFDPYDRIVEILGKGELEEGSAPLATVPQASAPPFLKFQLYEQNSHAYANAVTAYYEKKNYQQAIEKFDEAIKNAAERTAHDLTEEQVNEIIAKSMYWQAEAYVKMQDIPQALETFKALIQNCQGHYLTLAAQRRATELSEKNA